MLHVARMGARLDIQKLIKKKIRIENAQLFGMHANLYQECEQCDPNFKFLIDAFASKDTTKHTPLDLRISQVLVRRGKVKWEQRWKKKPLELSDLNVTAQLNCLTDDSLNLRIKRLDVKEKSGMQVNSLTFLLAGNKHQATLSDLHLELPNSELNIPSIKANYAKQNSQLTLGEFVGSIKARLDPSDFAPLVPKLAEVQNRADLNVEFDGMDDSINIKSLRLYDQQGHIKLMANGSAENLKQGKERIRAWLDLDELYVDTKALTPYVSNKILSQFESLSIEGLLDYNQGTISGDLDARTSLGGASIQGWGKPDGTLAASIQSDDFDLGQLLKQPDLGRVDLDIKASGQLSKNPNLIFTGRIPEVNYKGYCYRNIDVNQVAFHDSHLTLDVASADPNASLTAEGEVNLKEHIYKVNADIARIVPNTLNLTKKYEGAEFSGKLLADLKGRDLNMLEGVAQFNEFTMTDSTGTYRPGDVHLTARPNGSEGNIMLISPFLEAQVQGDINPKLLVSQIKRMVSNYLPTDDRKVRTSTSEGLLATNDNDLSFNSSNKTNAEGRIGSSSTSFFSPSSLESMNSHSSTPFSPVSLSFSTSFIVASFSAFVPLRLMIG